MMEKDELYIHIEDSLEDIYTKKNKILSYIVENEPEVFSKETAIIQEVIKKLYNFLPKESFSGKNAVLFYSFKHDNRPESEIYISPDIYITQENTVIYEIYNKEKYGIYAPSIEFLTNKEGKIYCEVPIKNILRYINMRDVMNFIENYINSDYEDYFNLKKCNEILGKL